MLEARLDLKVGFSCNNRCVFCVQGDKRDYLEDRSFEEICELLRNELDKHKSVVFTGGEATLRDDLVELVACANELGYTFIQLQTNARRISYMPYMRALAEAGLTEICPALHGSTATIHDELTRARGSFNQVCKGIRNARACGVQVITNSVVVKDNFVDLPALAALLLRLGSQQIQFAFVHPAGSAESSFGQVVPRFTEAVPYIHRALDIVDRAGVIGMAEAVPFCFMRGYERFVAEPNIPDTRILDRPMVIEDYTAYRWAEGKAKGEKCAGCSFGAHCEGPWHEYPREFGWDEFVARTDDPNRILAQPGAIQ